MVAPAHPAHAERVRHVVEPAVEAVGLVLEDVTVRKAGSRSVVEVVLDVTEDDEGGLDLDRVAEATRAVSDALDAADVIVGEYTLDVMSPGVDRPLTERRHFTHAVGHLVAVTLSDGGSLAGRLTEVDRRPTTRHRRRARDARAQGPQAGGGRARPRAPVGRAPRARRGGPVGHRALWTDDESRPATPPPDKES